MALSVEQVGEKLGGVARGHSKVAEWFEKLGAIGITCHSQNSEGIVLSFGQEEVGRLSLVEGKLLIRISIPMT